MPNKQGDYIWYELLTTDADAAQRFYGTILGWQVVDSGQASMDYRILQAQDGDSDDLCRIGGLMQITGEMQAGGVRPVWLGYIAVENVDASITAITAAGGNVLMPATNIPNVGRIALLADPQGVPFYIMRGSSDNTSLAFASDHPRVGHCAWNELVTTDPTAAKQFYGEQFGWQKDSEMDMGAMGVYEFLRHDFILGAVMPKPAQMPQPTWNYYFRVADIDAAVQQITEGGGQLLLPPQDIPGGDFIVQGLDPQGAPFALVGSRHA